MLRRPYLPRIEKAAKWLLTLGLWLGALRALRSLELRLPADHFLQHVIPLGTGLALLGGVIFLAFQSSAWSEKAARSIQEYRDRRAGTIHRAITSGGSPAEALRNSYYLYLRSFASTAHVKVVLKAWTQKRGALDPGLIVPTKIQGFGTSTVYRRYAVWGDLETLLADRLERSGSELVTLGRPGEQVGAGRIVTSEEEWQKAHGKGN